MLQIFCKFVLINDKPCKRVALSALDICVCDINRDIFLVLLTKAFMTHFNVANTEQMKKPSHTLV